MIAAFWGKAQFYALAVAGAIGALFAAYWRIRSDGMKAAELEQQKARDHLQEHYDEIDKKPVDVGAAYDHLRDGGMRNH